MKNVSKILTSVALLSILLLTSCKKEETAPTPTTGGLSVNLKIAQRSTGAVIPDNLLSTWTIQASLYSDAGSLLKTQIFNSNTISFTELNPGNYQIYAGGTVLHATYGRIPLTNGSSGGQVQAGKTAYSPEMFFYY